MVAPLGSGRRLPGAGTWREGPGPGRSIRGSGGGDSSCDNADSFPSPSILSEYPGALNTQIPSAAQAGWGWVGRGRRPWDGPPSGPAPRVGSCDDLVGDLDGYVGRSEMV